MGVVFCFRLQNMGSLEIAAEIEIREGEQDTVRRQLHAPQPPDFRDVSLCRVLPCPTLCLGALRMSDSQFWTRGRERGCLVCQRGTWWERCSDPILSRSQASKKRRKLRRPRRTRPRLWCGSEIREADQLRSGIIQIPVALRGLVQELRRPGAGDTHPTP